MPYIKVGYAENGEIRIHIPQHQAGIQKEELCGAACLAAIAVDDANSVREWRPTLTLLTGLLSNAM